MGVSMEYRNALHVSLIGKDNETYRGTLVLKNWTLQLPGPHGGVPTPSAPEIEDPTGASYYVIAVVLVYGMSIVMLIASHIKRNHQKLEQDKQIHKYFQEFMVVKERSSREAYKKLKKSIVKKLMWENNPTYRNLSRAIIPAIAVPVGGYLLTVTSEQELDALRRGRRGSSPATSVTEQPTSSHSASKQRRKGLGHLFNAAPPRDFELSVLERLTELKEIRQEVRARANSVAFSNASSFDVSGLRGSEVESGSESNFDNHSEDSHITLPAITVRGPTPEPPLIRRSPLPTIADTEDTSNCCTEDDDDDDQAETEDVWLMGAPPPADSQKSTHSLPRKVHFSSSIKHKSLVHEARSSTPSPTGHGHRGKMDKPPQLVRQTNVLSSDSENSEDDQQGLSDSDSDLDDENLHKITCV